MTTATEKPLLTTIEKLTECFRRARAAGEAVTNDEDGGTCNMDSPAFRIPRASDAKIQDAARAAGVTACDFQWFGKQRWYWLGGFLKGQGNQRARISTAATKALKEAAAELCPTMEVCEYQQMD